MCVDYLFRARRCFQRALKRNNAFWGTHLGTLRSPFYLFCYLTTHIANIIVNNAIDWWNIEGILKIAVTRSCNPLGANQQYATAADFGLVIFTGRCLVLMKSPLIIIIIFVSCASSVDEFSKEPSHFISQLRLKSYCAFLFHLWRAKVIFS